MKKILPVSSVSREAIQELTSEVGTKASLETEGKQIKELEDDKVQQGEYSEKMELWEEAKSRIYIDMDGVMINSRDNAERMEGKVGLVWSERELVKADTYELTDKRYFGSFTDTESLEW